MTLTLGVGFSQGAVVNFALNAGFRHPQDLRQAGDNHRAPYDLSSGRIFDGFIWVNGQPAAGAADYSRLSAPTIFLAGEATSVPQQAPVIQVNRIASTPGLNAWDLARIYSIRNMPLLDADSSLSLTREDVDWAYATPPGQTATPQYYLGGDRLRPVMGALLDALAQWAKEGVPPVPALFNGQVMGSGTTERIDFFRTGAPATVLPYVDDPVFDGFDQSISTITPVQVTRNAWKNVQLSLGAAIGSIVLPETACRRGAFRFAGLGPAGTDLQLFNESSFLGRWGTPANYDDCRVRTIDALVGAGLYDPASVVVDIDPEHSPNVIDIASGEPVTVAIFSTAGFDATRIIPGSLRLAGASQRGIADNPGGVRADVVDLNGDGRPDLKARFRVDRLQFSPIDVVADVWGETLGGLQFSGSDLVQVVR